ncbi:MAG: hypothetical protein V4647_14390 [Pseudomonadota bacterium]
MTTSKKPATAKLPTPKLLLRCNADYRWTTTKVTAFLRALARWRDAGKWRRRRAPWR